MSTDHDIRWVGSTVEYRGYVLRPWEDNRYQITMDAPSGPFVVAGFLGTIPEAIAYINNIVAQEED